MKTDPNIKSFYGGGSIGTSIVGDQATSKFSMGDLGDILGGIGDILTQGSKTWKELTGKASTPPYIPPPPPPQQKSSGSVIPWIVVGALALVLASRN